MSQFRNAADIITEILLKSGEPTNGNSPFQSRAVSYANKVHHAIIGGGSILNLNVDEPWVWARSTSPIVLELQPAFTSGSVTFANKGTNIYFSQAPSSSLEGWHIQALGKSTVYKMTQHTAAGTAAQLDSNFVDDSGSYNFRAFKVDYQVFPAFMYVSNYNDKVDFSELNGTVTTTLSATIQHGSYTPPNLIAQVVAQLNAVGTASYGGSYDTVANTFVLTASNCTFSMLGASGANVRRSTLPLIGMDVLDYTAAKSYTSTYFPNQVARLIEPFKMFMVNWQKEHFCFSTDPIRLQEDYPLSLVMEAFPDRFARTSEDPNGSICVRFNKYPKQLTKLVVDWIPQPVDLQNNTASFTKLPRQDVETLINGAVAMILYDKEDTKAESTLGLCGKGLDAMKKKNHNLLFRTGEAFGQIVPRADLDGTVRRFQYGYTISGSTAAQTTAFTTPEFTSASLTYASFQTAATVASVVFNTLPANMTLLNLIAKHSVSFTGSGITAVVLNLGTSANPTQFVNGFNLNQPVSSTASVAAVLNYFPAVSTNIQAQVVATGANLANLTAGVVQIYLNEATL